MNFRKPKVDQQALDQIREELIFISKFEADAQTDTGKNLIQLLDATIDNTIKEFTSKEIESFENETKIVVFLASCRSKLQTLYAMKNLYLGAAKKKAELNAELERILPKEE